jgi:hypothetical protein
MHPRALIGSCGRLPSTVTTVDVMIRAMNSTHPLRVLFLSRTGPAARELPTQQF